MYEPLCCKRSTWISFLLGSAIIRNHYCFVSLIRSIHFRHEINVNVSPHLALFQEKQKKLWHTPYYDNELKLKQLYTRICRNLPAYNCKLYQMKQLLRENSSKKVSHLLYLSSIFFSAVTLFTRTSSIDLWCPLGVLLRSLPLKIC